MSWKLCKDELPTTIDIEYLAMTDDGIPFIVSYCDGWNCYSHSKAHEIKDVVAWMEIPVFKKVK